MNKQTGFTIVELLIVIVVIGILAAITLVAFGGIQERARIASAQAFASQMEKKYATNEGGIWRFNECSGSSVSGGTGSTTGTISGTAAWSTDTPGGSGCSFRLNGSTRIRTTAPIDVNNFFKAAWIKLDSCGANNIVSRPDVTGGIDSVFWANGCRLRAGHDGNYTRVQSPNTLETGKWYHVAVEFDAGTYTLYEDGKQVARATGSTPPATGVEGANIGAQAGGNYLTGYIDDVVIGSGAANI